MLRFSTEDMQSLADTYNKLVGKDASADLPATVASEIVFIAARFGPREE